jgi:hypothetical protein
LGPETPGDRGQGPEKPGNKGQGPEGPQGDGATARGCELFDLLNKIKLGM